MSNSPTVSVIMPVYNSAQYLAEAVESILKQSFADFEFIIINDGSTDASHDILTHYQLLDKRIRLYHQENRGIVESLNRGCNLSRGKYIARMDSDDISLPERLAKQVSFLETHSQVGVCGTWVQLFGGTTGVVRPSTDSEMIRIKLLFESMLAHPSVMMRRQVMINNNLFYRDGYDGAEDYDLWLRFSQHTLLANIPEILLRYRKHEQQITQRQAVDKINSANRLRLEQLEKLGLKPTAEEMQIHQALSSWSFEISKYFVERANIWLCKLLKANESGSYYDKNSFASVLYERWDSICYISTGLGISTWHSYVNSHVTRSVKVELSKKIKYAFKCSIRFKP